MTLKVRLFSINVNKNILVKSKLKYLITFTVYYFCNKTNKSKNFFEKNQV